MRATRRGKRKKSYDIFPMALASSKFAKRRGHGGVAAESLCEGARIVFSVQQIDAPRGQSAVFSYDLAPIFEQEAVR